MNTNQCAGFEQWLNRPVYKAQCATAREALAILNIDLAPDQGLATRPDHPIGLLRLLPAYRTPESLAFRKQIAARVRKWRSKYRELNYCLRRYHDSFGIWRDGDCCYVRANPDFIAAAPELLEALKRILARCERADLIDSQVAVACEEIARAAIAKATNGKA